MIYVSHRMDEIRRITDKVAIFKDGRYIDTVVTAETDEKDMIKMMVAVILAISTRSWTRTRRSEAFSWR